MNQTIFAKIMLSTVGIIHLKRLVEKDTAFIFISNLMMQKLWRFKYK